MRPIVAITAGEPAGIGPEIVLRALESHGQSVRPVVYGHKPTLEALAGELGCGLRFREVDDCTPTDDDAIALVNCGSATHPIFEADELAAEAQFAALIMATTAALESKCSALVTAPISKAQVARLQPGFSGHTEYFAARAGLRDDDVSMVFANNKLVVGLIATHVPFKDVPATLTPRNYERTIVHMIELMSALHPGQKPRIAVAALNPHGGEGGLLGVEELETIAPACRVLETQHSLVLEGPHPADAVFRDALDGRYDCVVAAYHDQALIPLKLVGPGNTVNITMGLPFIRTSPDHGVAYDIARTGKASAAGMCAALEMAVRLAQGKLEAAKHSVAS